MTLAGGAAVAGFLAGAADGVVALAGADLAVSVAARSVAAAPQGAGKKVMREPGQVLSSRGQNETFCPAALSWEGVKYVLK